MKFVLALCLLFTIGPRDDSRLELVETTPIETTLGHDSIPEAHAVWLDMIEGAERSLDLAQFYVSDRAPSRLTPILEAIEAAAGRGVRVRFLADAKFHATYPEILDRFATRDGIEVRLYDIADETGGVLHAKYFLVDGAQCFVGSQNFDWRALEHIQELGIRVRSEPITRSLQEVFELDWAIAGDEERPRFEGPPVHERIGDTLVTPVYSPASLCPREDAWDLPRLVAMIGNAQESVRIQLLNYKAAHRDGRFFPDLENALRAAAKRGVKVELLLADWSKARGTIEGLQSLQVLPGIDVKLTTLPEWSGGFIDFARVSHSKYLVVDGERAWIGTSNWSGDYFHASRNVGLILEGGAIPARLEAYFAQGWRSSYAELVDPCAEYVAPRRR